MPTLNELYRSFRVGNVVTNASTSLRAERLKGDEVGINVQAWSERINLRGNLFWSNVDDPVANVTLSATPELITRQRQNLGAIRARGIELAGSMTVNKRWQLAAEYLLTDSTILCFPANRALVGLKLPQIPQNQFNFQISYSTSNWNAGVQGRLVGKQFDDDQNLLPLEKFFTLDAQLSLWLAHTCEYSSPCKTLTASAIKLAGHRLLRLARPRFCALGCASAFDNSDALSWRKR